VAEPRATGGRVFKPHEVHVSAQLLGAERLLDDPHRGVRFEGCVQQPRSLDICGRDLHAPPPARDPVCDDRKHEVQIIGTVAWIQERESFSVFNRCGFRSYYHAKGGTLDQLQIAVRVRTKLAGVVIERGSYACHHTAQAPGMPRVMEDLNRDGLP
jgi:hypothetical protein